MGQNRKKHWPNWFLGATVISLSIFGAGSSFAEQSVRDSLTNVIEACTNKNGSEICSNEDLGVMAQYLLAESAYITRKQIEAARATKSDDSFDRWKVKHGIVLGVDDNLSLKSFDDPVASAEHRYCNYGLPFGLTRCEESSSKIRAEFAGGDGDAMPGPDLTTVGSNPFAGPQLTNAFLTNAGNEAINAAINVILQSDISPFR